MRFPKRRKQRRKFFGWGGRKGYWGRKGDRISGGRNVVDGPALSTRKEDWGSKEGEGWLRQSNSLVKIGSRMQKENETARVQVEANTVCAKGWSMKIREKRR